MAEGESYPVRIENADGQTTLGVLLVFTDDSDQPEPGSQFAGWTGTGDPADVTSNGGGLDLDGGALNAGNSSVVGGVNLSAGNLSADDASVVAIIPRGDPGDTLLDAAGELITNVGVFGSAGITGAVSATRYVGGTADLAPTTGTFIAGDWVVSLTGKIWVCTVGGTAGTWVQANSVTFAPQASPTFTGTVVVPAAAGVTSATKLNDLSSYLTIASGALPAFGAWSSGTAQQNPVARQIVVAVEVVTDGTANAATCALAVSPDNVTYTTIATPGASVAVNTVGAVTSLASVSLPSTWYLKLTFSHCTVAASKYY